MSQTGAVLVTGAGRGIGRAIALRLAADGWAVAALSRTPAELASVVAEIEARGGRAVAVVADVTDEVAVEAAWTAAEQALGPITALVNDAGNAPVGPTASFALADWQHCLGVNLTGAFLCSREAFRRMPALGGGAITHISSGAGKHGKAEWAAYCAAKSGLHGLARALVEEGKPLGIRVNTVCPGGTETELRASLFGPEPPGTLLSVEEVADVVAFTLSPAAREVRGAELDVRKVPGPTPGAGSGPTPA
jgi:NAD(P)-dependent dehydrogenase (short-subunit alcohol dehydrogenase family)